MPGKFHVQRHLASYSPWRLEESNITEHTCTVCFRMITMTGQATVCHHTEILYNYWLCSPHCTFHTSRPNPFWLRKGWEALSLRRCHRAFRDLGPDQNLGLEQRRRRVGVNVGRLPPASASKDKGRCCPPASIPLLVLGQNHQRDTMTARKTGHSFTPSLIHTLGHSRIHSLLAHQTCAL